MSSEQRGSSEALPSGPASVREESEQDVSPPVSLHSDRDDPLSASPADLIEDQTAAAAAPPAACEDGFPSLGEASEKGSVEDQSLDSDVASEETPVSDIPGERSGAEKREEDAESELSGSAVRETPEARPKKPSCAAGSAKVKGAPAKRPAASKIAVPRSKATAAPSAKSPLTRKGLPTAPAPPSKTKPASMMRINQQPPLHQESFGEGIKTAPSGSENDSDSEISDAEQFLAKGAFLLTPSHELSLEKASAICEKMNFNAPFSLTKTATGILFKFARPEDYQATFKKGFHKVTGARFYKKIPIPCRPQKTFTVFVLEVPEEVPEEDIRHSLYKLHSVVEVVRLAGTGGASQLAAQKEAAPTAGGVPAPPKPEKAVGSTSSGSTTMELGAAGPPPIIRVTLASLDDYNLLLQNGLDFYGATFFPTEAASPSGLVRVNCRKSAIGNRILDVVTASGQRVRDLLPVFDSTGFSKIPPPAMKTIKPRPN